MLYNSRSIDVDSPNVPAVHLGEEVEEIVNRLRQWRTENNQCSRGLNAFAIQTINHLDHVRFSFRRADDSHDYTHADVLDGPLPQRPTLIAIHKAHEFFKIVGQQSPVTFHSAARDIAREQALMDEQQLLVRALMDDPYTQYHDFQSRLAENMQASFTEFAPLVKLLQLRLETDLHMQSAMENNPWLNTFRELTIEHLSDVQHGTTPYPYTDTILAIERATEFFDIVQRSLADTPSLYHSKRYEYYMHYLLSQPGHVMFPASCVLGTTDLLRVRGVPVAFVGVNTSLERVDGFFQTPYEFFHHDVNHSRRMFQFYTETAAAREQSLSEFAAGSNGFLQETLLPLIRRQPDDTPENKSLKTAMRMILFEVLHEDALAADQEVLQMAIMRPALHRTPFEEVHGAEVVYVMEPGATTLAYVFRKLFHTFYDTPEKRYKALGDDHTRSRKAIVQAALAIMTAIADEPLDEVQLEKELEQLVVTDEGFPRDFFNEVLDDIHERNDSNSNFFVSKPQDVDAALMAINDLGINRVHSIFGYSDIAYADGDAMLKQVERDLASLDPATTTIAIGATVAGIGAAHEVAKRLGFKTLGIISSKSLIENSRYSDYVDNIIVVKDTEWGGYDSSGQLSPTTQVFVAISNGVSAYGGGEITAVSVNEITRQRKYGMFRDCAMRTADGAIQSGPAAARILDSDTR